MNVRKHTLCKIGLHDWKILASIKISRLVIFVMHEYFRNTNYDFPKINNNFLVQKRQCTICNTIDNEFGYAKQYLIDEIKRLNNAE